MRHPALGNLVVVMAVLGLGLSTAVDAAEPSTWRPLFNGSDLSGWRGGDGPPGAGWVVEDGAIVRKARGGDLWTVEQFGDFVLELEFLTKGNSGVLFRKPDPRTKAKDRLEIQILPPSKMPSKHSCGALYDCVAPSKEMARRDQWNQLRLTSANNRVQVVLNGEKVIDVDLEQWTEAGKNPDGTNNKFEQPLRDFARVGHIGFQDHGAVVRYRNIRIKPLASATVE
jgi:hypothetical protein